MALAEDENLVVPVGGVVAGQVAGANLETIVGV